MPLGAARFGLGGAADLGKLELIQYQSFTNVTEVFFTSIQESTYSVHMAVCNQLEVNSSSTRSFA